VHVYTFASDPNRKIVLHALFETMSID
jgi:hypothetical protein